MTVKKVNSRIKYHIGKLPDSTAEALINKKLVSYVILGSSFILGAKEVNKDTLKVILKNSIK